MTYRLLIFIYLSILICLINCYDDWVYQTIRDTEAKNENIDDCGVCNKLTESFEKEYELTSKKEGIENYENSEIRLTEIQEKLCNDLQYAKNRCLRLAQEKEDLIEFWWLNKRKAENLFQFLCIRQLKFCCLPDHFGPKCEKCPGYPNKICSNNGQCEGSGSRKGTGKCICNPGSEGEICDQCAYNYTMVNDKCEECYKGCKKGCFKLGKDGCIDGCAEGFREDENKLCQDINECEENDKLCVDGELCRNIEGSYHCIACDKVCKTCYGLGSEECLECADGYVKEGKKCIPYAESKKGNRNEIFKYLLYVALTIFSMCLMSKRPLVALLITILLSVYIGLVEYANLNSFDSIMQVLEEFIL